MLTRKIKKLRKIGKKFPKAASIPREIEDGPEWSDSLLMILERLDDLRQFVIDEFLSPPDVKRSRLSRYLESALNHVDREVMASICELALLRNDVRENETRAQIKIFEKGECPDVRRCFHGHSRRPGEKHVRFIKDRAKGEFVKTAGATKLKTKASREG